VKRRRSKGKKVTDKSRLRREKRKKSKGKEKQTSGMANQAPYLESF